MNHTAETPEVRCYLAALDERLTQLPTDRSEEILFGVREHIGEAMARGDRSVPEILAALGTPDGAVGGLYLSFLPIRSMASTVSYESGENALEGAMFPGLSAGATLVTLCIPVAVAIYLLVVGLRRAPARN